MYQRRQIKEILMKRTKNCMLLNIRYYLIICCITILSCKNTNKDDGSIQADSNTITVKLDLDKSNDFTYPIDSIGYIKLETSDECLIGNIKKVILHDGLYYIQDNKASSVFVFDETGKFIFKICKKGKGPGEYNGLTKLFVDYNRKQILIYDELSRKMIYYTLDGKHIKDIHHFSDRAIIKDMFLLPNGSFLCYTPEYMDKRKYWGIWKIDSTGQFDKFLWEQTIRYTYVDRGNSFFYELKDNKVGLWCSDYDDIIHFSGDSIYKYLSMKINKSTVTDYPEHYKFGDDAAFTDVMWKLYVFEKDNFIYTRWWNGEQYYRSSLYLKNEKKTIVGESIRFGMSDTDAAYGGRDIPFNRTDQMIHMIFPENLEDILACKHVSDKNKSTLTAMLENEDDNPVLEILYLKK